MKKSVKITLCVLVVVVIAAAVSYGIYRPSISPQECPDEKIINRMPSVGASSIPSTYYIQDGARREVSEYDADWVSTNCTVPESIVY